MKTGFICASGFNLVATATRDGKRMIAVVLGASSSSARALRAAQLLEQGFTSNPLSWLTPSLGTVDQLVPVNVDPPNLRDEMCSGKRKRPATDEDADVVAANGSASTGESAVTFFTAGLQPPMGKPSDLIAAEAAATGKAPTVRISPVFSRRACPIRCRIIKAAPTPDPRPQTKLSARSPNKPDSQAPPRPPAKDYRSHHHRVHGRGKSPTPPTPQGRTPTMP